MAGWATCYTTAPAALNGIDFGLTLVFENLGGCRAFVSNSRGHEPGGLPGICLKFISSALTSILHVHQIRMDGRGGNPLSLYIWMMMRPISLKYGYAESYGVTAKRRSAFWHPQNLQLVAFLLGYVEICTHRPFLSAIVGENIFCRPAVDFGTCTISLDFSHNSWTSHLTFGRSDLQNFGYFCHQNFGG